MKSKMKYYHISLELTPHMCKLYTVDYVISEDPLELLHRNHGEFAPQMNLIQYREISEDMYLKFKSKNPHSGNPKYWRPVVRLNKRDWSGYIP